MLTRVTASTLVRHRGYAGSRYWAAGIGARGAVVAFEGGRVPHSTIDAGVLTSLALEARFRPVGSGFSLGPSLAFTRLALTGGTNDIGSADNILRLSAGLSSGAE